MKTATVNVTVTDLPEVTAAFKRAEAKLAEAEATIQRLIAQADEYARRVQALEAQVERLGPGSVRVATSCDRLAKLAWEGTVRCCRGVRPEPFWPCDDCSETHDVLKGLGFDERMREWAGQ